MKITLAHGSGGLQTSELINNVFANRFSNPILNQMEDSAVVEGAARIAVTTDSFVVNPLIFKGGDIGRLAICGTVNDLLMRGSIPRYITCGFILEEGLDSKLLETVVSSMADTAEEAGVVIVAGDTKVINGEGGMYINTAGVGFADEKVNCASANCKTGDVIIVSGNMGDHHAAILSNRMQIENNIQSDCAPLVEMVKNMLEENIDIHAMRDITRGGLATVLNELADASGCMMEISEELIPVAKDVKSFSKILGLDPLYMGNEGKLTAIVNAEHADRALEIIKGSRYGQNVAIIGRVTEGKGVVVNTHLGGRRGVGVLMGEGLPRIC